MAKRMNFPPCREARREGAKERAAARAERTWEQQLAALSFRGHPNCAEAEAIREAIRDGQIEAGGYQ